jgi:hypothetical protein
MSERSDAKIAHALYLLIFTCGGAFSLYLIIHPEWRIVGVIMAAGVAMMLPTLVLPILMDDMPQAIRKLAFRGWHGKYRAFEGQRARVIEGEARDALWQRFRERHRRAGRRRVALRGRGLRRLRAQPYG